MASDEHVPDLARRLRALIEAAGGWLGFDRFMAEALYAPGLGYYARGEHPFGLMPSSGSDFVTAPEMSPWFGRALAVQVAQGLSASGSETVTEFGAGSGALAAQLLDALGDSVRRYLIVELSGTLRGHQRTRLARFGDRVEWLDRLPEAFEGVIVGNEVLDAMPVKLLHFDGVGWSERGVADRSGRFAWDDRPTEWRAPVDAAFVAGTTTELGLQGQAFVASVAERLRRGLVLLIDYGFPQAEYYHPQRLGGTLMCHRGHTADTDPLSAVGRKDITAHVDFTAIALAAESAGLEVLGYTSQARFLVNCGLIDLLGGADLRERTMAMRLVAEHEMGELFKVIACGRGVDEPLWGFRAGDRTHRL